MEFSQFFFLRSSLLKYSLFTVYYWPNLGNNKYMISMCNVVVIRNEFLQNILCLYFPKIQNVGSDQWSWGGRNRPMGAFPNSALGLDPYLPLYLQGGEIHWQGTWPIYDIGARQKNCVYTISIFLFFSFLFRWCTLQQCFHMLFWLRCWYVTSSFLEL